MSLCQLAKNDKNQFVCPACGKALNFVDGTTVTLVDGKLDMEAIKPKYECNSCSVFYREVLNTGYFDIFELKNNNISSDFNNPCSQEPVVLRTTATGVNLCPNCMEQLHLVEAGAVQIIDGKANFDNTKPKFECNKCNVIYKEVLDSGYYHAYPNIKRSQKKILATSDLQPLPLKPDNNNQAICPRCNTLMDYIEGKAVCIVNGVPDMENVNPHFRCNFCDSIFRRIANTEYFQWTEK